MAFKPRDNEAITVLRCLACGRPTHNDADENGEHHGMVCLNDNCGLRGMVQSMPRECGARARKLFERSLKTEIYISAQKWRERNYHRTQKDEDLEKEIERLRNLNVEPERTV